jgi:hypothetical protein
MKSAILALAGAAVAIAAAPVEARQHSNDAKCTKWDNHRCVAWRDMTRAQARREAYRVGYAFGPRYGYTEFTALPQPVVTRYHLRNNFRYVERDGYVYVVNPRTYRVVRVIPG